MKTNVVSGVDAGGCVATSTVGSCLRAVRRQKGWSLDEVESLSEGQFKASVMGSYERGERVVSTRKLQALAAFYEVPVVSLLPEAEPVARATQVRVDLVRLGELSGPRWETVAAFCRSLQTTRGDFAGKVLTVRSTDLQALASMMHVSLAEATATLEKNGLVAA
jgi:transcriptional regulator with XRE-family HTH domain